MESMSKSAYKLVALTLVLLNIILLGTELVSENFVDY